MTKIISLWLIVCVLLVVSMIAVGGYTRLSGSGLSITEWKPIHGAIPPIGQAEWEEEFAKYREIPQYHQVNKGMTLDEFKRIFWPEFLHRLLGRLIGAVFLLPLVFFWMRGAITHRQGCRLFAIFSLGGLQGFMGWYMVASGLSDNIYVSHFRLAAHLALAFVLLGLLVWEILALSRAKSRDRLAEDSDPSTRLRSLRINYTIWFFLLFIQILYGAFTAGLKAGLLYNTWPTMNGEWIPALTSSIFTDHTTVQFIHRWLAFLVAGGFGLWCWAARAYVKQQGLIPLVSSIGLIIILQITLGIFTLLTSVSLPVALLHQMTAVGLYILAVLLAHRIFSLPIATP